MIYNLYRHASLSNLAIYIHVYGVGVRLRLHSGDSVMTFKEIVKVKIWVPIVDPISLQAFFWDVEIIEFCNDIVKIPVDIFGNFIVDVISSFDDIIEILVDVFGSFLPDVFADGLSELSESAPHPYLAMCSWRHFFFFLPLVPLLELARVPLGRSRLFVGGE